MKSTARMAKADRAVFLIDLFKPRLVALTAGIFPYFRGNRLILSPVVKLAEYIPSQIRGRMPINAPRIPEKILKRMMEYGNNSGRARELARSARRRPAPGGTPASDPRCEGEHILMKSDQMAHGTLDAGPQKGGVKPRPFSGWALEAAQELEWQSAIRLVSRLFSASDLRRGAAFLALSAWSAPGRDQRICLAGMGCSEFVTWLLEEDPSEIAEVLDSRRRDPQGLARLGREPLLRPEQYRNPFL